MEADNEGAGPSDRPQGNPLDFPQIVEAVRRQAMEEELENAKDDPWVQSVRDYMIEGMGIDVNVMEELFNQMGAGLEGGMRMSWIGDDMGLLRGMKLMSIKDVEEGGMRRKKFKFDDLLIEEFFGGVDPYEDSNEKGSISYEGRDILTCICLNVELAVELGKHLDGKDILNLCLASRHFYNTVNTYMLSSVRSWVEYRAPEAARIFHFQLYAKHLIDDPLKRTWSALKEGLTASANKDSKVRKVPGLRYLQLVLGRDKCCSDMLAIMARCGHRMPETMHQSLLRLWLLMDVSTTKQRRGMLEMTNLFTDADLYNIQMFLVKLSLLFNDPVYGPCSLDLVQLMMGQRGLFKLWQLITRKRFYKLSDILELKLRYDMPFFSEGTYWIEHSLNAVQGIPIEDIGQYHREGWGAGGTHLSRPDELIPLEAVRRGLNLDDHLNHMAIWGYFDWQTGENLVPSLEEMHIDNEAEVLANVDTTEHWKPKHVLKKRWSELTPEQQEEILSDEEDDQLRAQAWSSTLDDDDDDAGSLEGSSDSDSDEASNLDDEIRRGYIVPEQPKDRQSTVPEVGDAQGWVNFVNQTILGGMMADIGEEAKARARAYRDEYEDEAEITSKRLWDEIMAVARIQQRRRQWMETSMSQAGEEERHDGAADVEEDDEDGGEEGQGEQQIAVQAAENEADEADGEEEESQDGEESQGGEEYEDEEIGGAEDEEEGDENGAEYEDGASYEDEEEYEGQGQYEDDEETLIGEPEDDNISPDFTTTTTTATTFSSSSYQASLMDQSSLVDHTNLIEQTNLFDQTSLIDQTNLIDDANLFDDQTINDTANQLNNLLLQFYCPLLNWQPPNDPTYRPSFVSAAGTQMDFDAQQQQQQPYALRPPPQPYAHGPFMAHDFEDLHMEDAEGNVEEGEEYDDEI
ncbi:hypothetical protein J3F83DRAFT_769657 [Trichoderma novae-zelandiae]